MARLVISDGSSSRSVELTEASTVAGRAPENKIIIDDKQASRRHFTIDKIEYGFKLVDLESRNGTRVNDRQVNQMLLRPGDRIQIGKHVLTFEDPNFKEPPPEVAAKLGPPPVQGRVDPPSTAPDVAPPPPPPSAALPVGADVKPVVLNAPAPVPEIDYRSKRNRSGHTTAVQKNVQQQLQEESKTLTMVAIGAGVFIFVILVLIFLPSRPTVEAGAGPRPGGKPPPGMSEAERSEKESNDWTELSTFCERNRNLANYYPEIIKRVDEFEKTWPRSPNGAKARDYKSAALNGIKTSKNAEFSEAERLAQEDLKRNDFGSGLKKIRDLLSKYKTDADIHERLVKLKEQAVEDAKVYFRAKAQEADAMKFSRKDEARDAYQSLLKVMGNGSVPELDDYCKIARLNLEGLQ
jgi:pSer/pThr/pTyr-binding forkhead associated (FHA) protein